MKRNLHLLLVALAFSSCSNIIIPYYTTVEKITKVTPGMEKGKVVATLGIEPYEIFHSIEDGCEIHQFKYKHKEVNHGTLNSYENIKGAERFVDPSNLYVYYKDGKMESLVTDAGKKGGSSVLSFTKELQDACDGYEEAPIYGCMDKKALNYNKEATVERDGNIVEYGSTIRIGDCEYCACDYKVNKKYDPKKECGEICIPVEEPEEEEEEEKVEEVVFGPDCTLCDLAEKENAQIHIDLLHKSGRLWNRKLKLGEYISKVFDWSSWKKRKSNNKKSK